MAYPLRTEHYHYPNGERASRKGSHVQRWLIGRLRVHRGGGSQLAERLCNEHVDSVTVWSRGWTDHLRRDFHVQRRDGGPGGQSLCQLLRSGLPQRLRLTREIGRAHV